MLVGAVLMVLAGYDPVRAYSALFRTPFTQSFDIGETIRTISPLIMTGLAVAIAFRTGLFNIGAEGQYIIGQLVAIIVALKLPLPPVLHALVAMILGGLAGALWAFLPGLLKATRGVHEVISTIMMNFLAFLSVQFPGPVLAQQRSRFDADDSGVRFHPLGCFDGCLCQFADSSGDFYRASSRPVHALAAVEDHRRL